MMNNEKLILNITNYILKAFKDRQDINKEYIEDIANMVINNLELDCFVKNVELRQLNGKSLARFYLNSKTIIIDLNKIIKKLESIRGLNISYESRLLFYYIETVEILLHEIEHVNQTKKALNHEQNLEAKILTASIIFGCVSSDLKKYQLLLDAGYTDEQLKLYFNEKAMIYKNNYNIAPEERLANYYSGFMMIKILESFKDNHDMWQYKVYTFLKSLLNGYDISLNPTKTYLEELGTTKILTEGELKGNNLALDKRLSLGLKIEEAEKAKLNNLLQEASFRVYR